MLFDLAPQTDAQLMAAIALRSMEALELLDLYLEAGCTVREAAALIERQAD